MLFAASAAASAAVAMARFQGEAAPSEAAFQFGEALAETLFYVFAIKMAAVFMLVSSTIGRRTNAFPGWLVAGGAVAGIVMLFSVSFFQVLAVIFPAWVAVVSVLLLRAHPDPQSPLLDRRKGPPSIRCRLYLTLMRRVRHAPQLPARSRARTRTS